MQTYNTVLHKSIDFIDAALGPDNHGRALIVATYEGLDTLQTATIDLAESVARRAFFARVDPLDPLVEELVQLEPTTFERWRRRQARLGIEDAAIRAAAGGDHLINAYLRLAWETTVATKAEVIACGFDPSEREPRSWATVRQCRSGLTDLRPRAAALLPSFRMTPAVERYADDAAVEAARLFRDEIVHRARPGYREAVPFGRTSTWNESGFKLQFAGLDRVDDDDSSYPSFEQRREVVGGAIQAGLALASDLWDLTRLWLGTVGVSVKHDGYMTTMTAHLPPGDQDGPRYPRASRDPTPFMTHR